MKKTVLLSFLFFGFSCLQAQQFIKILANTTLEQLNGMMEAGIDISKTVVLVILSDGVCITNLANNTNEKYNSVEFKKGDTLSIDSYEHTEYGGYSNENSTRPVIPVKYSEKGKQKRIQHAYFSNTLTYTLNEKKYTIRLPEAVVRTIGYD